MDATISLHISGRRNNWFSERLHQFSISSFRLILLLLCAAVLASFGALALSYRQSLQPIQDSLGHLHSVSMLSRQLLDARWQVEHALASGGKDAYSTGEAALAQAVDAIEAMLRTVEPFDYFALSRLEQTTSQYRNTFRSLASLISSGAPAGTQAMIRQQLDTLGSTLVTEANASFEDSLSVSEAALSEQSALLIRTAVVLTLLLGAFFALSLILVMIITRRSAYALHQIGQAARQITAEQYDTRIDLSGETNPDIVQLSAAFNRMAETLKSALRAESAAQQQNHAQLMKLAQQERKTAVLEERQRIARELHDSVKQQLFSITLSAGAAINLLEHAPGHVRTYLEHIQQAGHSTQAEMTTLLQELVPFTMQEKRLEDALLAYLNPLCEIHSLKLLWRVDGTNTLTIAQEHALFRAVQEAVANVVRHSGATVLHVSLYFGLITQVIVEDNGVGFVPDAVPATSTGLALMRTRLLRAGGRYELQTTLGMGTRLTILIDLRRMTARA